jgi:hypothetical protein
LNTHLTLRRTLLFLTLTSQVFAEPVTVRYPQGTLHGFLTIRSEAGVTLGYGDFVQTASGDRVTARTTLHFRDGSLDDETAVFTQHQVFQFVSDHHIQRGPFFKNAIDALVEASGQITIRTTANDGKVKEESSHIDLPPDIANGIVGPLLINLPHNTPGITFGMVLPTPKGRLIKLNVTPDGTGSFIAGASRKASLFRIKLALGGIAGAVAPIIGKQPSDVILWVLEGDAPVIVREDAQLSEGGPVVSIQLAGTSFPRNAPAR